MLPVLNEKNKDFTVLSVNSEEFNSFGRVLTGIDPTAIIEAAQNIQMPEMGASYSASVEAFENLEIAKQIQDECFGTLPTQVGYCWGHCSFLNATEWHTSSEINIAVTDLVLILGHLWDVHDNKIDASQFSVFYVPKGTVLETYATTLHYCPCQVTDSGFGWVVALPKNTNTALPFPSADPLLSARNKWLIAHNENEKLIARGAVAGISGPNYEIKY